jgi:hypothetical protein
MSSPLPPHGIRGRREVCTTNIEILFQFWPCATLRECPAVSRLIYIDGGEWYQLADGNITFNTCEQNNLHLLLLCRLHIHAILVNVTLAIDLSVSWTNATVTTLGNVQPTLMQPIRRPSIWYDTTAQLVRKWS